MVLAGTFFSFSLPSYAVAGADLVPGGSVQQRLGELDILFLVQVFMVYAQTRVQQRFFGAQHVHHQDFSPGQSSTAVRRDGGLGAALGGADDVEDLIRRSQELLEYTRREYSFSSEEEEEEEETEQMDLEEQPSRFQSHFRPLRYCASILRGGLCWRGSSCTGSMVMVAPLIMQLEFQQSVLFFSEGASDPVHDQSGGHSSCMQRWVRIVQNCAGSGRSGKFMAVFAGYASHAVFPSFVGRPVLPGILVGIFCAAVAVISTGRRHPCVVVTSRLHWCSPWLTRCCARCAPRQVPWFMSL